LIQFAEFLSGQCMLGDSLGEAKELREVGFAGLTSFRQRWGRAEIEDSLVDADEIIGYESAFDRDHGSRGNPFGFVVTGDVEQIGGSYSEAKAEG
jgi:hypothetical protein